MSQQVVRFNTKEHTLSILWGDEGTITEDFENVMTIKEYDGYYEILQKQESGKNAPLFRLPINSTIIRYIH
jgi:hypothetical protein